MTAITALWSTYQWRHGFRIASTNPLVRLLATDAVQAPDEQPCGNVPPAPRLSSASRAFARATLDGQARAPFSLASAYETLVMERWTSGEAAAIAPWALAAFYRVRRAIPRGAQLALRRALIRRRGVPAFPSWPYDESVRDLLAAMVAILAAPNREIRFRWFWPGGARAALALTHDVESAAGLRNALRIADMEAARGLRSSFNVVKSWYEIDRGILRELAARGFEIGVHGVWHDRSLFSTRAEFESQQPLLREAADAFGAVGFRSPATYRVIDWLAELPFEYDCTVPLSDPYEPQPGGCCSPWPYFIGDTVELPWTLTQDHTLFTLLRHTDIGVWLAQVERLRDAAGLIQPLTHPDPGYLGEPGNARLYGAFLDRMAEQADLWGALPRDIARWWRHRDSADEWSPADYGVARLSEDGRLVFEGPA
jgi:peptidoglycan/xylan/chitin deacetylase (PgdA/CDA1 family)